eukprot:sb/3462477/
MGWRRQGRGVVMVYLDWGRVGWGCYQKLGIEHLTLANQKHGGCGMGVGAARISRNHSAWLATGLLTLYSRREIALSIPSQPVPVSMAPSQPVPVSMPPSQHHQVHQHDARVRAASQQGNVKNVIQVPQTWVQSRPSSQLSSNDSYSVRQKSASYEDEYSYVPANYVFLRDGTINPRYLPMFEGGYFMFRKLDAPWLNDKLHIFGIPIDVNSYYIVYIPALGAEQSVRGAAISQNVNEPDPHNPRTFMARVSGVNYICSRIRAAPHRGYNVDAHRESMMRQHEVLNRQQLDTGSVVRYVPEQAPTDTFSIFGVPVYKSQTYYVYIPQFNNEYTVPGINVSPNPDDKSTLLVTINRGRYHATSIRPVFPDLVYPNRQVTKATKNPEGQIVAYGIPINTDESYSVFVPAMKKEYIVFGGNIALHDNDTVKVTVNGVDLVGTSVRHSLIRNNNTHGDKGVFSDKKKDDGAAEEEGGDYKLVAFGVPINTDKTYEIEVKELGKSVTVRGCDIATNDVNPELIRVKVDETWYTGVSVKEEEDGAVSDSGPTFQLGGIITAFGIPILPDDKYKVLIPTLGTECIVYGRNITRNLADPSTVTVIISGMQFTGENVRPAKDALCPKYPVGTVVNSSDKKYRSLIEEEEDGSDSSEEEREVDLDLNIRIPPNTDCLGRPSLSGLEHNKTLLYRTIKDYEMKYSEMKDEVYSFSLLKLTTINTEGLLELLLPALFTDN